MDSKWTHKYDTCDKIDKQIMNKKRHENMRIQMTKQDDTQALQSLIFDSLPSRIVVSTFPHLLRMFTELLRRAFEIEANRCLWHQKDIKREVQKTC